MAHEVKFPRYTLLTRSPLREEEMYSSYSFLTTATDGSDWSASSSGRALPPLKGPLVPTG